MKFIHKDARNSSDCTNKSQEKGDVSIDEGTTVVPYSTVMSSSLLLGP